MRWTRLRYLGLALVIGVVAAAGCADDPASVSEASAVGGPSSPPAGPGSTPLSSSPSPSLSSTLAPASTVAGTAGLSGVVIARTDVSSVPERPVPMGSVVVVPADVVEAFWKAFGIAPGGPPVLGKVEFDVEPGALPAGAVVVPVADGRFASDVTAASVLLCLADDLSGDQQGPPFRVTGCARYERGAGADRVRLSTGFGGVMAKAL